MRPNVNKHLNRRLFLRGLGGAAVAAPFLSSLGGRSTLGQAASEVTPRRLIVMFTHHGCLTDRWFPTTAYGTLRANDLMGTSLEALSPHASKLLVPRGIRAMNEWGLTATLGQGNGAHVQTMGSYFTCAPVTPHAPDPSTATFAQRLEAMPIAPSLDHVCARQMSPNGQPLLLRVGGATDSPSTAISYSAAEVPYAGLGSLAEAMASIAGLTPAETFHALRRQNVVDLVKDDLATLRSADMSMSDKRKLEAWAELLHQASAAVATGNCTPELAAALGLSEANIAAHDGTSSDPVATKVTDELDGADLYSNLAVLAAVCDPSRVIVLKYPANHRFSALDIAMDADSLAHRVGSAEIGGSCVENVNEQLETIDRYYAQKFAHLVAQLDAFEEGEGTLLDNTATVWFQEFSDGSAFNLNNMPIIQAGSCGGYFKTGQAVNLHDGEPELHRGNSTAACGAGIDPEDFKSAGTPAEIGNAPINKYYCNLMNAIGVRAGTDGFAEAGGTQEVTHYGIYDDTTDFASGGQNPPRINNPGGFAELRANS